ncbi:MAG: glycosyltransferase family 87 protein [Acidobacteriaceae bacterium]
MPADEHRKSDNCNNEQPDRLLELLTSNVALTLGALASAVSIAAAIRKTILYGLDFQWSDVRLLLQHRDPWAIYLSGDAHHEILLNQVPNFLHELYVLLLPFGFLSFAHAKLAFAVCNLLFVGVLVRCVARLYELDARRAWLLLLLVLTSTPFRVTIQNGQNDALALICIALWAVVGSERGRGLLLGVAYEKYSMPPVLALFLLMRRRWKLLLYSLLPPLLGFFLVDAWLPTPGRALLVGPFRAALHGGNVSRGIANIMAVTEKLLQHVQSPPTWTAVLPYVLGILLACGMAGYFAHHAAEMDGRILLACLMATSQACFKHQIYDFLALTFCLAIALKATPGRARVVVFGVTGYFWYVERILHIWRWEFHLFTILPSFILLLWLIAATWKLGGFVRWKANWEL